MNSSGRRSIWFFALLFVVIAGAVYYFNYMVEKKVSVTGPNVEVEVATTTDAVVATSTDDSFGDDGLEDEPVPPEANTSVLSYKGELTVNDIAKGQKIESPLHIEGTAAGWYVEGSFPIQITDDKGTLLGAGRAVAEGDWATAELVPFEADITFVTGGRAKGFIVFNNAFKLEIAL